MQVSEAEKLPLAFSILNELPLLPFKILGSARFLFFTLIGIILPVIDLRRYFRTSTCHLLTALIMHSISCASPIKQLKRIPVFSLPTKTAFSSSCSSTWLTTQSRGCACLWEPPGNTCPRATTPESWSRTLLRSSSELSSDTYWTHCSACCTAVMVREAAVPNTTSLFKKLRYI